MAHPIKGGAIIAGIGQTEFSKNSGRSELQLAAEASRAAILDAGLTPDDIDGMVTFTLDTNDELALSRNLGVTGLTWWSETPWGGAGANSTIQHAAAAVTSGAADAVLVYRAFNERSGRRFGQPNAPRDGAPRPLDNYYTFGLDTPAKTYALWYQRYMHEFNVQNEDFGRYTVVARKHAATNPAAWFYQRPITLDDHQASRWIVEPILRKLDCCQESDGGVALVITRDERAADLPNPAVRIAGISEAHYSHGHIMYNYYWEDIAEFPEAKWAGDQVYDMTGLGPDDVDVLMIYENFSPVVFLQLEAFGFCGRGEAKDFIADGNIELGGKIPLNTNGGLLGEAYIHGVNNVLEGTRQIRGTAANQVAGAEHVLCATGAGALMLTPA
jgi:acetyl-CoA acetyltransferase